MRQERRMTALMGLAFLLLSSSMVWASHEVAILDGTSWKVEVAPDEMTKKKGEKELKETLTFADGMVSLTEYGKMGFSSSPYTLTRSGEKDWSFKVEATSPTQGTSVWTGRIHENTMEGKLILTKTDGTVLTYALKGNKLD